MILYLIILAHSIKRKRCARATASSAAFLSHMRQKNAHATKKTAITRYCDHTPFQASHKESRLPKEPYKYVKGLYSSAPSGSGELSGKRFRNTLSNNNGTLNKNKEL